MIDLCNLSSDDETFDNISSSDKSGPSSTVCDSPGQSSTHDIKYNTSNIKTFLREQPEKYVLVENRKVNQTKPAACWSRFALPAMKDENSCNTIIRNFAVCRSCYTTCSYTLGLTKSLNSHKCAPSTYSSSSFRYFINYRFIIYYIYILVSNHLGSQELVNFLLGKRRC